MRMNWLQRTIRDFSKEQFEIEHKQFVNIDRLMNAINYLRAREDDEIKADIPNILRMLIVTGIEDALKVGFLPFAKTVKHYLESKRYNMNTKYRRVYTFFNPTELKALNDLYAMVHEYLEDEHLHHYQDKYDFCVDDLVCFFIDHGLNDYNQMPVLKASNLLNLHSI